MGLIERRTGKPFISVQAKATESEDEIYVGPNWIRSGQNVDAPVADAEARREVKSPRTVHGKDLLGWALLFIAVGAVLAVWLFQ